MTGQEQDQQKTDEAPKSPVEASAEALFNFAINRDDVKMLMAQLPEAADVNRTTVEYELQILKIISVGWSIAYFLEEYAEWKQPLVEHFWSGMLEFSKSISETTELMSGVEIDYFQILKDRLDIYVNVMAEQTDVSEPAAVIGPTFAETCGNRDDAFTVMTGARMFKSSVMQVRDYLNGRILENETMGGA